MRRLLLACLLATACSMTQPTPFFMPPPAVSPTSRVVCLTASISRDEMSSLIEAGAVACLTKDEDLEQIVASIHSAAAAAA